MVVVETKLWRNPGSRREVISQVLDYVKDIAARDFTWLEAVWARFCGERGRSRLPLLEAIREMAAEDIDEAEFVDRLHRVIERGDIIALIVGDGIETRLQQLVAHLCRDSAHLRYSLGLVALRCYEMPTSKEMLVLPELVQEVEPVERAYVRIELDQALAGRARISSVVEESLPAASTKRVTLSEEDFFEALHRAIGEEATARVRRFIDEARDIGIEPEFKSTAVMLKAPDPDGEAVGASLFAISKSGSVFNPDHGRRQVFEKWGWGEASTDRTIGAYWRRLHAIDERFSLSGIRHVAPRTFLPVAEVIDKLDVIQEAMRQALADIEREAEEAS